MSSVSCGSDLLTGTEKQKMDKYERFEKWLLDNHSEFSALELRAYDDNVNNTNQIERNSIDVITEEKKEMNSSAPDNSNANNNDFFENERESEMRGVHSKIDIPPNTICVSIPKKCLITVEMGQATDIGQIILKSDLDLDAPKHIFLMIFLLYDRKVNGDKSFFKPYYDILPKTLSNIPIFWSQEELKYLDGSYLLAQIADRNEAITEDYYSICEVAPELASIATLEEFKWARMCVCSRNFGLQIDGHRTSALVPHADMLNHHRPRETKWTYDDDLGAFTITTLQRISRGSQVFDSYGQKCNHRFLLNYGFAVEDNRELDGFCPNEVPIELGVLPNDPIHEAKYEFWTRGENEGSSAQLNNSISAAVAAAAVGAARSQQQLNPAMTIHSMMQAAASAVDVASDTTVGKRHLHGRGTRFQSMGREQSLDAVRRIRVCVSNNENTRVLFSMLRVLACNEEELCTVSSSASLPFGDSSCPVYLNRALRGFTSSHSASNSASMQQMAFFRTARDIRHPIGLRNEKAAMEHLLKVINSHLDLYPCSLAKDITDLMDEDKYPRFSNRRHAKIQVRGEKEVLHHFVLWAQTAIDLINIIEKEVTIIKESSNNNSRQEVDTQQRFEYITQAMERDEGMGSDGLHHTIIRYCCDVLGALRQEALKVARRGIA